MVSKFAPTKTGGAVGAVAGVGSQNKQRSATMLTTESEYNNSGINEDDKSLQYQDAPDKSDGDSIT